MIQDVDAALVRLLRDEVLGTPDIAVVLDAPNRGWLAAARGPTVNLFLYDVRENVVRREVMHEPVLDDTGRIVGRRAPAQRFDLHYLVSVWGLPDPSLEHQVVAVLLAGLARFDVMPAALVPEEYHELGLWHLNAAAGGKRMMPGQFGGDLKLQLELSVTVPLPSRVAVPTAPAVTAPMDLRMSGAGGQAETVPGRSPGTPAPSSGVPSAGSGPGANPAQQREQLARAVAAAGPGTPPGPSGAPAGNPGVRQAAGAAGPAAGNAAAQHPVVALRQAIVQAAQAQAALANAQARAAMMLAGGPPAAPAAPPAAAAPAAPPAAAAPATPPAAPLAADPPAPTPAAAPPPAG